ncbi:AI-2E family transporter [Denitrobaculum tricleocarpae]|nr:AI-2E family transporter [Denitrobaculum tricleocarpae]
MQDNRGTVAQELTAIRYLLTGIFALLLIVSMFFAKDVLLPIVMGFLLSLTLSPLVRGASRVGFPAALTALLLIGGLSLSILVSFYMMSGTVTEWVEEAPSFGDKIRERLTPVSESVEAVKDASKEVEKITEASPRPVQRVVVEQPGLLVSAVSNVASAGTSIAVALVLALFLLASGDLFYAKLIESFSLMSEKKKALKLVYDIERRISHYLLTITCINAGLGLTIGTSLHVVGLPDAHIWGTVAFFLNFLPYVGALVGTLLVAAFAVVTYDSLAFAAVAPGIYLGLAVLEGQFVTPMILGRRLELNTVSVLLTVIFWGWLWGIAGALMAVPFLVLIKVVCDHVQELQPFGNFLSARETSTRDTAVAAQ